MERTEYRMEPAMEPTTGRMMKRRGRRMMRGGLWFSAFVFGAAVGSTLALLFAPRRGAEMRSALAESMGARGVGRDFQKRVESLMSSGRATPSDLISQTQRELDDLRTQAVNRLEDVRLRGRIVQKQAELRYLQGKERLRRMR